MDKRRKKKEQTLILIAIFIIVVILAGGLATYIFARNTKELNQDTMFNEEKSVLPEEIQQKEEKEEVDLNYELPEGAVIYNGEIYNYNDAVINLLFIGVDGMTNGRSRDKTMITGNQSDTLMIISIDTEKNAMKLINIPRDTLTEIELLDIAGNYAGTVTEPIALAHSYGDGGEVSAELVVRAVRKLMYDIPIYRYLSMNIDGVGAATEAIGGVTVELMDDFTMVDKSMKKGTTLTLNGKQAITYLSARSLPGMIGENLGSRMPRQIQFFQAFFNLAKEKTSQDFTFPLTLMNKLDDYICYNVKVDEISYLTQMMLLQDIAVENIITISGEMTEDGYVIDDEALHQLILETFYEKQKKAE